MENSFSKLIALMRQTQLALTIPPLTHVKRALLCLNPDLRWCTTNTTSPTRLELLSVTRQQLEEMCAQLMGTTTMLRAQPSLTTCSFMASCTLLSVVATTGRMFAILLVGVVLAEPSAMATIMFGRLQVVPVLSP